MYDIFQHQRYGQPAACGITGGQGQDQNSPCTDWTGFQGDEGVLGQGGGASAQGGLGPSTTGAGGELEARQKMIPNQYCKYL